MPRKLFLLERNSSRKNWIRILILIQAPPHIRSAHHTYIQNQMATLNEFLAILNTRRYTDDEWKELPTRLKAESTDTLKLLYFVTKDKDNEVNETARRERRHLEIVRRWETLLFMIRDAYDHAKLRENLGPWILSSEHALEIMYYHCKIRTNLFNPPPSTE